MGPRLACGRGWGTARPRAQAHARGCSRLRVDARVTSTAAQPTARSRPADRPATAAAAPAAATRFPARIAARPSQQDRCNRGQRQQVGRHRQRRQPAEVPPRDRRGRQRAGHRDRHRLAAARAARAARPGDRPTAAKLSWKPGSNRSSGLTASTTTAPQATRCQRTTGRDASHATAIRPPATPGPNDRRPGPGDQDVQRGQPDRRDPRRRADHAHRSQADQREDDDQRHVLAGGRDDVGQARRPGTRRLHVSRHEPRPRPARHRPPAPAAATRPRRRRAGAGRGDAAVSTAPHGPPR